MRDVEYRTYIFAAAWVFFASLALVLLHQRTGSVMGYGVPAVLAMPLLLVAIIRKALRNRAAKR